MVEEEAGEYVLTMYKEYPHHEITSEDIERLGVKWKMLDQVSKLIKHPSNTGLVNIDYSGNSGTHWTTVCTNKSINTIFYYDPLGFKNDGNYPATSGDGFEKQRGVPREICEAAEKYGYDIIVTNKHYQQYLESWLCGYYALYMEEQFKLYNQRMQGGLSKSIFQNIVYGSFGKSPSPQSVKKVMAWYENK